jgi:general secretion pathway protein K
MTMRSFARAFPRRRSDGFIVVAVLWILGALAALVAIYALLSRQTALAFADRDERVEARELARAGVEVAAYQLTAIAEARPVRGTFRFRLGRGEVAAEFRSENARIDLNFAAKEVLAGLFVVLGAKAENALNFADRIVAWRTPAADEANDKETMLYREARRGYGPRHGPFQHTNELSLVLGLPPALVERALPHLTVFSGQPEVNVLNADAQVLAALPGLTAERLKLLLGLQGGAPQDVLNAQLGITVQYTTMQPSRANRVTVEARLDGTRARTEAVILLLDRDSEPYRVLSWRDENGETASD